MNIKKSCKLAKLFFLVICAFTFCAFADEENETPLSELPRYGDVAPNSSEAKADREFIEAAIRTAGSREAAFDKTMESGWHWFYEKDYGQAMRRFNQAWLLNPTHPAVFHGFGTTLGKMGQKEEFIKWNKMSAEGGWGNAQINMGWAYLRGYGVERNIEEAVQWYRKAAEQNHPTGLNTLGLFYDWGYGVERNPEKAKILYQRADKEGFEGDWKHLRRDMFIAENAEAANMSFQEILNELEKTNPL